MPEGPTGARIRSLIEVGELRERRPDQALHRARSAPGSSSRQIPLDDHISAALGFSEGHGRHRLLLRPHLHARTPRRDRGHRQGPRSGRLVGP
ncbi:MAG: hypothetical protein MZV64_33915 [Ignavibacteriales bacterium]|nr:hypothetical protein [Ignavibacteriales bacterium]